MGKLLQSRLLSELCPGGAGRPIELGIFIPHPRHLLRPQTPLCPSTLHVRRCSTAEARWCWYGRNIALIRRPSQELPVGQLFKFRPQRWDCYLYGTHEDARPTNRRLLEGGLDYRFPPCLCFLKVLEVLLDTVVVNLTVWDRWLFSPPTWYSWVELVGSLGRDWLGRRRGQPAKVF